MRNVIQPEWTLVIAVMWFAGCGPSKSGSTDDDTGSGRDATINADTASQETGPDSDTESSTAADSETDIATEDAPGTESADTTTADSDGAITIRIVPLNRVLAGPDNRQQFEAECADTNGNRASCTEWVTWRSSSPGVVAISNEPGTQGLATSVSIGQSVITAEFGGVVSNEAAVRVSSIFACDPLVLLSNGTSEIDLGGTVQLTAECQVAVEWVDLTPQVIWRIARGDPVLAIDDNGLAEAVRCGTTTLAAVFTFADGSSITSNELTLTVVCQADTDMDAGVVDAGGETSEDTGLDAGPNRDLPRRDDAVLTVLISV